jgi:universal stress protein A
MQIKRILVPIDFSHSSRKALDYAIDFARHHQAEIILIHVIEPLNYALPRYLPEPTVLLEDQRREASMQLAEFEAKVLKRYPHCRSEVHFGVVYQVIVDVARKLGVDLIIIATHGRTGLAHLLMGSVAEKVLRMAACPVLSVRTLSPPASHARPERHPRKKQSRA